MRLSVCQTLDSLRYRADYLGKLIGYLSVYNLGCELLDRHRPHLAWAMGQSWRQNLCDNTPISLVRLYRTAVPHGCAVPPYCTNTAARDPRVADIFKTQGLPPLPRAAGAGRAPTSWWGTPFMLWMFQTGLNPNSRSPPINELRPRSSWRTKQGRTLSNPVARSGYLSRGH